METIDKGRPGIGRGAATDAAHPRASAAMIDVRSFFDRRAMSVRQWLVRFVSSEPAPATRTPLGALFAPGYGVLTVSLWVTYFAGLLVIYLSTGWLPTLFKEAGLSISAAAAITAMFQTGGILGVLATGWAIDKGRPTWVIAAAYLGGAVCLFAVSRVGALAPSLAWWVFAAGFFMNGAQTGLNGLAPSRYPTVARATGVAWMQGMGRFGSIVGSSVGGMLIGLGWGFGGVVELLAVPAIVSAIVILGSAQRRRRRGPDEQHPLTPPRRRPRQVGTPRSSLCCAACPTRADRPTDRRRLAGRTTCPGAPASASSCSDSGSRPAPA